MCLIHSLTFKDCPHVWHWEIQRHEPAIYCSDIQVEHQGESTETNLCPDCARRARQKGCAVYVLILRTSDERQVKTKLPESEQKMQKKSQQAEEDAEHVLSHRAKDLEV